MSMDSHTEKKVSHCPSCQKPVLNNGQFASPVTFSIRCPWCQQNLKITVQVRIVTELAAPDPIPAPELTDAAKVTAAQLAG